MSNSAALYNTFGNEVRSKIVQDTLITYLDNATIKFVLPEASTALLTGLTTTGTESINPAELDQISQQLVSMGFGDANARTLAIVLIRVAKIDGVNPQVYFDLNMSALELAVDTYNLINQQRPAGNRIGLTKPISNNKSPAGALIKP